MNGGPAEHSCCSMSCGIPEAASEESRLRRSGVEKWGPTGVTEWRLWWGCCKKRLELWADCSRTMRITHLARIDLPYDYCWLLIAIMSCSCKGLFHFTVSFNRSSGCILIPSGRYLCTGRSVFTRATELLLCVPRCAGAVESEFARNTPCPLGTRARQLGSWQMEGILKLSFATSFKIQESRRGSFPAFLFFMDLQQHPVSSVCTWPRLRWQLTRVLAFSGHRNYATVVSLALSKGKLRCRMSSRPCGSGIGTDGTWIEARDLLR